MACAAAAAAIIVHGRREKTEGACASTEDGWVLVLMGPLARHCCDVESLIFTALRLERWDWEWDALKSSISVAREMSG